jgi:hypothetical protein
MARKCYLYSKANYPITIKYDKKDLVLPANSKTLVEDTTKVGVLPPKVRKVDIEGGI